jgi:DNA-binding transcriptional LysR family regulator
MKLDLRQLRYVLALDRHRNFARAAEDIGISQPALSRSIQVLEQAVGAKLFDRDRAGLEPTAVGARLIELARPLVTQARVAEREIEQLLGLAGGLLRVGAGPYASEISIGKAVGRLAARHPAIRADVQIADWPELYRMVLADELDVAVAEISHATGDERVVVEPLPEHQAYFFCRAGHPLATRSDLTAEDILAYPLAVTLVPRRLLEHLGTAAGSRLDDPREGTATPHIRVETPYLARAIVRESDAIGAALPTQIEHDIALGDVVTLSLRLPWLKTHYGILRLARRTPSPAVAEFLQVLREVEQEIEAAEQA